MVSWPLIAQLANLSQQAAGDADVVDVAGCQKQGVRPTVAIAQVSPSVRVTYLRYRLGRTSDLLMTSCKPRSAYRRIGLAGCGGTSCRTRSVRGDSFTSMQWAY